MDNTGFTKENVWKQLLTFGGLIIASMIVSLIATPFLTMLFFGSEALNNISDFNNLQTNGALGAALFLQALSQLGIFVLPSILFFVVFKPGFYNGLGLNTLRFWPGIPAAIVLMLAATPFIGQLYEWNMGLKLPAGLKEIEDWMHTAEEKANQITEAFVSVKSLNGLAANMLVMAIIPAIAEELLFRGVIQQLIARITKRPVLAVWLTAIVFSMIHMQFFGFFPRLVLGVFMGYLYLWSGSLWLAIVAHFTNNAAAVIAGYLFATGITNTPYNEAGSYGGPLLALASLIVVSFLLFFLRKTLTKTKIQVPTLI